MPPRLAVTGIASDSRNVAPGSLFFAVPGVKVDGMSFASQAVAAGAVAVVGEAEARRGHLPYIQRSRRAPRARALPPSRLLSAATRDDRGGDGNERQKLGRGFHATALCASGPQVSQPRHARRHHVGRHSLRIADDAGSVSLHASSTAWRAKASLIWPWRRPRTASISAASTAFGSVRRGSPILDAIISIITATTEAYAAAKLRLFDTLLPADAPAIVNADGPYADVFLRRNSPIAD